MKVLITTVFTYPHLGGLSTHVQTLKEGLEQRGHEVDVFSFNLLPEWKQKGLVQIPSFLLNKVKKGLGFTLTHDIRQNLLTQYIKKHNKNYDIINAQDPYATLASIDTGIPTVSTVHGYLSFEAISRGTIIENSKYDQRIREIEIQAYQKTLKNITVDTRIKNYIKDCADVDALAIKNFINVNQFKPSKDKKADLRDKYGFKQDQDLLFVPRRLTKKNGVIYPLLALKEVLKKKSNVQLIYAGTGEEMKNLKNFVEENNLTENVHLLGAVDHKKMTDYYALSDVVLVPSVFSSGVEEATSISALESMGSGSPLIASAIGGLKEIVEHNVDGLLTEEKNVEDLTESILSLLSNPAFGEKLAENARQKIEREYSHLSAAKKFEEVYMVSLGQK
ncbi:glycosyltransferase family 4 protein [Rossellomorea aquimaris]|uniref:glycosyltransferase family 4 protein n=1 Tax=Rossellomorea aquimaris TaxID=189382 RepID=UPI001CD302FD|nr:glycosyltransferase family 4 protein [Rossellomorea aquimaris]MCA1055164.1 glycosyltransferase family 4 protein [Rossellomorea aquimaris]